MMYQDWQWLNSHFGSVTDPTRWTPERIGAKLTNAILFFVTGGLGFATGAIGFLVIRKALDEDKVADVKRWSFIAGVTGILPGLAVGGLLELFIWRAHAAESFTMFGLLGAAPAATPPPGAPPSAAEQRSYDMAAEAQKEAKRKAEYQALFAPAPATAYSAPAAPGYYGAPATSQTDYAYPAAEPAPAPAPAAPATNYAQQPSGAPICSCGRAMEWVAEYNRYYCYTDDKYEGET